MIWREKKYVVGYVVAEWMKTVSIRIYLYMWVILDEYKK